MTEIFTNCGIIRQPLFLDTPRVNCVPDVTHSQIPFVHQMFCRWATQPAHQFMWVLVIDAHNKEYLLNKIAEVSNLEPPGWRIGSIIADTWTEQTQNTVGCIFAQGVNLPGETVNVDRVGITEGSRRGFINAPIINGRSDYEPMEIGFLETNQSFVDGVLRPWSILIAHEGLIAQPKNSSIKADIHVYQLAKAGEYTPNIVRKAWTFKDCAPTFISPEQLTYDSSDYGKRQAQFVYNSYHINQDQQSNCGTEISEPEIRRALPIENPIPSPITPQPKPQLISTSTNKDFIDRTDANLA